MLNAAVRAPLNGILKAAVILIVTFVGISGCSDRNTDAIGEVAEPDTVIETEQESHIGNISIAKIHPHGVDIEVEYHYDGNVGNYANVSVELITEDKISNPLLKNNPGSARQGSGKKMARIERPRLEVEEYVTKEVKVAYSGPFRSLILV